MFFSDFGALVVCNISAVEIKSIDPDTKQYNYISLETALFYWIDNIIVYFKFPII